MSTLQKLWSSVRHLANRVRVRAAQRTHRRTRLLIESLEPRWAMATYFVDFANGLDSNPGTIERPFKTPAPISEGGPLLLNAGDTVNFRGGRHDWSEMLSRKPEQRGFALFHRDGTATAPITLQAYGAEKPVIVGREAGVENALIWIEGSDHVRVLGLELTGSYGPALFVGESTNVEIANNYIHDVDGNHDNNIAGIYALSVIDTTIHHNLLHDNYDRARAATPGEVQRANSRNIVVFGDGSDRVHIHSNKVFNTPLASGIPTGEGIWIKHASEIPGASFEIDGNIIRDVHMASVGGQTSNVYVHNNLIVNSAPYQAGGGDNLLTKQLQLSGIRIENNTLVNSGTISTHGLEDYNFPPADFLTFKNNIVTDNRMSYNQENGILQLEVYGSDSAYRAAVHPANLRFKENTYYNPFTAPIWNVFSGNGGPYGELGGNYNFPEWRTLGGDANSAVLNPQLNASYIPQNPAAAHAGWLSGSTPRLTMYIPGDVFSESAGANASSLTLIRSNMDTSASLTVSLSVSDSTEIQVPQTVTFPAGASFITIPIAAINDNLVEPTRAVQVFASVTTSGEVLSASDWVRVLQVTPATTKPSLSISDVTIQEGTGGTRNAVFTVTATSAATTFPNVAVTYATVAGTATAGSDYTSRNGTVSLSSSQRTATISVPIVTDSLFEANEQFFVRLSGAVNATIADGEGVGTIVNDDANADKNLLRVWRPGNGTWYTKNYASGATTTVQWGLKDDVPVPGDYNGDGQTDLAVWRPKEGNWYVRIGGTTYVRQLGLNGDIPVPADYNGDGRTDLAVYRPSDSKWWLRDFSTNGTIQAGVAFGAAGDIPVPADFNGDGRADLAVYRRSNGTWWVMDAVNVGVWIANGRIASHERDVNDLPVPGDYNGDLLTDFAVWNSATGEWKIRNSNTGVFSKTQYGLPGEWT